MCWMGAYVGGILAGLEWLLIVYPRVPFLTVCS